jgi:2-methylisocitrate lyase-like PEP mutase family enzyme
VSAVDVPVTADCEAGYGLDPHAFAAGLLGAGAVGCNLEDTDHATGTLRDPGENAAFLAAVKQAGRAAGVDVVLNARVDVHVRGGTLEDGLVRARAYREAGADCVYPIFCHEEEGIAAYVEAVGVINVAVHPSAPTIARMGELGVARASFGGGLFHVAMKAAASYEP